MEHCPGNYFHGTLFDLEFFNVTTHTRILHSFDFLSTIQMAPGSGFDVFFAASANVLFACANSVVQKVLYDSQSIGLDGEMKFFKKPWLVNLFMFIAMALNLIYYYKNESNTMVPWWIRPV